MLPSEQWDGCLIIRLDYPMPFERLSLNVPFLLRSPSILAQMFRLLRERRIDTVCIGLLDSSAIYLLLLRRLVRFRMIVYLHGSDTRMLPRGIASYAWLLRRALRAADAVIAVSAELAHEASSYAPAAARKIRVIPNGVDVAAIKQAPPRPHPRPYIAFIGRLVHEKDIDTLIEAFHRASPKIGDVDLLLAGVGRMEKRLREKASAGAAAARIQFLGRLDRQACYSLLNGALFLVLPSRTEGCPIAAIEARAAGKALLGSDIPGIARLVEDGCTGVLFSQGDAAELADLIEKYCTDRDALAALEAGARAARSPDFDLETLMPRHLAVLEGAAP